ncbi:MAG: MBL fold metallo-hydrolase [Zetaproteobacteria bacterium]|nr:MBL fold metallo-hydrolase [Pseudobdellovibrionaceae bacterium]|tara:strand:- start:1998 stop:2780 length:783 start_codon:yes stop_codon:yes gene_type:complete
MGKTLDVTILGSGTSTGVPVIGCSCQVCKSTNPKNKRSRSSILIHHRPSDQVILVDTSPDMRMQLLRENVSRVDHILYTHTHADHLHGFDDLRALFFHMKRPIHCWAKPEDIVDIKTKFSYAFKKTNYTGAIPQVILHEITEQKFYLNSLEVECIKLPHGAMESLAFKIGKFAYATDFKSFSSKDKDMWKGRVSHMIASSATKKPHPSHSCLAETLSLFKELKVEKSFITHMSHDFNQDEEKELVPENVFLSFDGLSFSL